jgi:sugar phosphate isomerase/epimerase
MRIGIDSYSYHRRYGEIRAGEQALAEPAWALEPSPVVAHARALGVDSLMLETCYLPGPESSALEALDLGRPPDIGFSWGHPWPEGAFHGLDGGRSAAAEVDLARWIAAAGRRGHSLMRITLGSPLSRGDEPAATLISRLIAPVRRAADVAAGLGVALAIENHGDLTAAQLAELVERVDRANVGVTLDTVNLIRLGDDMVEGSRVLAPWTLAVHLKDHRATDDPSVWGGPVCVALGEGVAPLPEVLAVLDRADFDGPVCVELASLGDGPVDEFALIERSVAWLRDRRVTQ